MKTFCKADITLYSFEKVFQFADIDHFITARSGGVSKGPYASLNIGYGTDDFSLNVLENRHILSSALKIPIDYFVMCNQVHGSQVKIINKEHRGLGAMHKGNAILATDAMITSETEICLFVMSADCVPLLFYDPVNKIIGAAHAGWRGTVKKIAVETINAMKNNFNCNLNDIQVGIGPSIGKCCYNVGEDVCNAIKKAFGKFDPFIFFNPDDKLTYLDLWAANKYQLLEAGIKEDNIEISNICTKCHADIFYSSRKDNGNTGRFGAGIMMHI